jgi:type IV secretory pathway VirB2 component (pilin)
MVFANGGYESNILLGALLKIIGPTVGSFLAIKAVTTIGLVAMARGMHSLERPLSILMLAMGMFLVGNNAVVILFQ